MISKIDLSEQNLTSNSGTLMLYNHADAEGIFDMINEEVNFYKASVNKIFDLILYDLKDSVQLSVTYPII